MPETRLQFFSPSYRADLERFCLLRKSIRRFAQCPVTHVVSVPHRDLSCFRAALSGDEGVRVIAQEPLVAGYFYAPLWFRTLRPALGKYGWRLDNSRYAGRKGWIIQQIVKLSAPEVFTTGPIAVVDSDLVFIRPFAAGDLLPAGEKRVLLRNEPQWESARQRVRMERARQILKTAPGPTDHHYMAFPAIWYPDWVRSLRIHLESTYGKPWQQVLFEAKSFSEYLLYGVFVEEILKPMELEPRTTPFEVGVWERDDFDALVEGRYPERHDSNVAPLTLVVQSNIGMPVREYAAAVERFIERT